MDRFLLKGNKRCESENKEGTSSTSGKSVKHKNRKYDDSYLDFGFTSREVDGEERPQCVLCMKVLASECMLPSKLKCRLETTHPSVVSKHLLILMRSINMQLYLFSLLTLHVSASCSYLQVVFLLYAIFSTEAAGFIMPIYLF
jgi:hypothetical protein